MDNAGRQIVKIIKEICEENSIEFKSFSYDWILQLSANNKTMFIYGYKFPNNNAAVEKICNDKAAMSDVLKEHCIPHVEHFYFMSPNNKQYTGINGDWNRMTSLLTKFEKLVCKSNNGTGGRNVYKVENQKDLEIAVHQIFLNTNSMSISPYVSIKAEYRVILVNSKVGVIYQKKRPFVIGDGLKTVHTLIELDRSLDAVNIDSDINLEFIPEQGELVEVSWKHNLGQGASAFVVSDMKLRDMLTDLALSCALTLDIGFASVDIVENIWGEFQILEVNSGVMMENFSKISDENYNIAKGIYREAIIDYLKLDDPKYQYTIEKPIKQHFVLPVLQSIAHERGVTIIPDKEEGNFSIFVFNNGRRFVAKDYPFNINFSGSISLCTNKAACTEFLSRMGFKTPKQKYFVRKQKVEITLNELKKCFTSPVELLGFDFPMIIKPNSLSQGIGVQKIYTIEEGIVSAKKILNLKGKEKLFLLQEYCEGHDYRIVVLNNEVIQAYERIAFHIVGDGINSIQDLLTSKVETFKKANRDKIVDIADQRVLRNIQKQGFTLDDILPCGVLCKLQDISNLSLGGTTIELTSQIAEFYKNLAVNIAKSLNLQLCGIDLIAENISSPYNTDYFILEVNSAPGLDNYAFDGVKQEEYVKDLYRKVFSFLETQ